MAISAIIVSQFNQHHNYPTTVTRDIVRYVLFCSASTIVLCPLFLVHGSMWVPVIFLALSTVHYIGRGVRNQPICMNVHCMVQPPLLVAQSHSHFNDLQMTHPLFIPRLLNQIVWNWSCFFPVQRPPYNCSVGRCSSIPHYTPRRRTRLPHPARLSILRTDERSGRARIF